jgi:hypothetical protein
MRVEREMLRLSSRRLSMYDLGDRRGAYIVGAFACVLAAIGAVGATACGNGPEDSCEACAENAADGAPPPDVAINDDVGGDGDVGAGAVTARDATTADAAVTDRATPDGGPAAAATPQAKRHGRGNGG